MWLLACTRISPGCCDSLEWTRGWNLSLKAYLCGRKGESSREGALSSVSLPNGQGHQGWARPRPGVQSSMWLPPMGDRDPSTPATSRFLF